MKKIIEANKSDIKTFFNSLDIKLVIFDLHGTLTNRTSIHPYHIEYRNNYIEKKIKIKLPQGFNFGTDEAFEKFSQLDKHEFYKTRDNDPLFRFDKIHKPNPILEIKLKELNQYFITVLFTDSYLKQIIKTLNCIGINNIFDEIIGVENGYRKSQSHNSFFYNKLCSRFQISKDQILIVGDRMDKDINPVLKAGGNGIKIKSNKNIIDAIEIILTLFTNK